MGTRPNSPNSKKSAPSDLSVAGAVSRFALAGAVALAVVAVIGYFVLREAGTSDALREARDITRLIGNGVVEPNLTDALVEGRGPAVARFDRLVRRRVLEDPIVRVKLWTASGGLVYSDEPRLVGERFRSGPTSLLRFGLVKSSQRSAISPGPRIASSAAGASCSRSIYQSGRRMANGCCSRHTRSSARSSHGPVTPCCSWRPH
jgi:hypothetical protein